MEKMQGHSQYEHFKNVSCVINYHVRLDRDSWVVLKNKKSMGDVLPAHRIQQRSTAGIQVMFQNFFSTLSS